MESGQRAGLFLIGIEIGGTKLQLVAGDESGAIRARRKLRVEPEKGGAGIRCQIEDELPGLLRAFPSRAVGIGFGGPVDWKTGRICRSHQIEGWSEFDLGGWIQQVSGVSLVMVENDANTAALGEALHGAGSGFAPVFYVTLGSGVGGGLVVEGRIYHGAAPGEAEIGHVRLDRTGVILEERCSGWAVDRKIRELEATAPSSFLWQMARQSPGAEARHLVRALEQGDCAAQRVLAETAEDLAFGLSHVVHLFHPQVIVLGGGLAGIGEPLRCCVEANLRRFTMDAFAPGPRIALAALGEDAVPVGALCLAGG